MDSAVRGGGDAQRAEAAGPVEAPATPQQDWRKPSEDEARRRCVIIGAGPAGLTAAFELDKAGVPTVVFEGDDLVGGISRTVNYKGFRFDIGGHRFFTKVTLVHDWWMEMLGSEMLERPRLSRIFYNEAFFDYPLKPMNALRGLGVVEAVRVILSYARAQLFPEREERNLEQWVSNRFGRRLYSIFFKTYTEKVWGIPCTEIGADWAAQRIKNLNLVTAIKNAFLGSRGAGGAVVTTLIDKFHYPRFGPGMMWERVAERLTLRGRGPVMKTRVVRLRHDGTRILHVVVRSADGVETEVSGADFISTMPVRELVRGLDPPPPPEVLAAAERLKYRDFVTVGLILDRDDLFPDNWIYVHSDAVRVGRIQNFKAWSPDMVPREGVGSLGLEYFVQENDDLWSSKDEDLIALGRRECAKLGLIRESDVSDGVVIRMPKAYPVYDQVYQQALATIREYLIRFTNLQLVGRNGQHRYNNQDHSMVTALYAARNIMGEALDVWDVNVDEEYHEEVKDQASGGAAKGTGGDRLVPRRLEFDPVQAAIREAFARFDPVALGGALGVVGGVVLFVLTAALLVRGGEFVGFHLSLLSNYLLGYTVTWGGAFLGALEAGVGLFAFGYLLAAAMNAVIGWHERALIRRFELSATIDSLGDNTP